MKKRAESVSIIGGADGPTSIFLAGTSKKKRFSLRNLRRTLRQGIHRSMHKRRKARAEASIRAGAHTLDEVIRYIEETYNAKEIRNKKKVCRQYEEQRKHMKEALIMKHKPELLGDMQIVRPENFDEESLKKFWAEAEARTERAAAVPEEMFPMDYYIYEVIVPETGRLDIEIEKKWGMLGISYSGSSGKCMRTLRGISKDIYRYYGVTQEDIRTRSERYQRLVLALSEG